MAKFNFGVAVAFGAQAAEGSYNDALDAVAATLSFSETPGADTKKAGLLLGAAGNGVRDSGLALSVGRGSAIKGFLGSTFTRPLSDFLKAEIPTFTFAFPFVGNRADAAATPVDADATPLDGIDALLEGAGLLGAAWGSGVGWSYKFASPAPMSALVYYNGNRLELLDCRCVWDIDYPLGTIPIATVAVSVGSIKERTLAALPTLTFGEQASVTAPKVETVGNQWQDVRGFSEGALAIGPNIEDIGDSNAAGGFVKEQTDREVKFEGTLYGDDTVDKGYEYSQIIAAAEAALDQLSWQVGANMTGNNPAEAIQVLMPFPELNEKSIEALGTRAGYGVELVARGTAAGGGNDELEIIFR